MILLVVADHSRSASQSPGSHKYYAQFDFSKNYSSINADNSTLAAPMILEQDPPTKNKPYLASLCFEKPTSP
jgi:hypothetical protein